RGSLQQTCQIVQRLMKATNLIAESRQLLRSPDSALEESAGIADHTGHVPDQFMRRAYVGSGAKIRKRIRRPAQCFLRPVSNRSQKMFQQSSLLFIHGKSIEAASNPEPETPSNDYLTTCHSQRTPHSAEASQLLFIPHSPRYNIFMTHQQLVRLA